jgi:hypothetical protein
MFQRISVFCVNGNRNTELGNPLEGVSNGFVTTKIQSAYLFGHEKFEAQRTFLYDRFNVFQVAGEF